MTFQEIEQTWQAAAGHPGLQRAVRANLGWRAHGWFTACQAAVANGDLETIETWLHTPTDVQQACLQFDPAPDAMTARAYLRCAQAILHTAITGPGTPSPEAILQTLRAHGLNLTEPSEHWWRDLIQALRPNPERPRVVLGVQPLLVCLVEGDSTQARGEVAELTLELLAAGRSTLYPDLTLDFVPRDAAFRAAEDAVCSFLHNQPQVWPLEWDVRWKITRPDAAPLLSLAGGSMGAAFALGLATLFAQHGAPPLFEPLRTLSLKRLLLTATCTATGVLEPVAAIPAKLAALRASPEIRCVILAAAQREREVDHEAAAQGFTIRRAPTLQNAVQQLADYIDHLPEPFCPLRPFRKEDARYFFGREQDIADLYANVTQYRCVVLDGPSGSGKSSLVHAGLLPHLKRHAQDWDIDVCVPGDQQFAEVQQALLHLFAPPLAAEALPQLAEEVSPAAPNRFARALQQTSRQPRLLILDQLEKLFDPAHASDSVRFLEALHRLVQSDMDCRVLVTVQSDTRVALLVESNRTTKAYKQLTNAPAANQQLSQLPVDELPAVLTRQAAAAGLDLASDLAQQMVQALDPERDTPEASRLPVLQMVLHELLEESRKGHTAALTLEDYNTLGNVNQIFARYADKVLDTITAEERRPRAEVEGQVRDILLKLVSRRPGSKASLTSVTRDSLDPRHASLLPKLQAAQLVVIRQRVPERASAQDTVEIAHQSLLTHWELLQTWIVEDDDFLTRMTAFQDARAQWQAHGETEGYLLQNDQLRDAHEMYQTRNDQFQDADKDFLRQSGQYERRSRFFWPTLGYILAFSMVWRWLFNQELFGSFLQPLPPWTDSLSPEAWNGALGGGVGACYVIAAFEGYSKNPTLHRLPQAFWLLVTGLLWGATVLVFIHLGFSSQDIEKIGWVHSRVQYAFMITGLGWSTGLALGEMLSVRVAPRKPTEPVPVLWRFWSQVSLAGLCSLVPPFVLQHLLTNIPANEVFRRAWGESLGQWAIASTVLFFYYGFRWGLWDNLSDKLWLGRDPMRRLPGPAR